MNTRRKLTGIALAATAAAAMTVAGAGTASAGNFMHLQNVVTGKCVDVKDQSQNAGAIVHQWDCASQNSQRWNPRDAGNGFVVLENQNSGWCLDVRDDDDFNGAQIVQSGCETWDAGHLWRQVFVSPDGTSKLVSALGSGRCLEVNRASRSNGAKVQLWECSTSSNAQYWKFW